MSRHEAREHVFNLIFQLSFRRELTPAELISDYFLNGIGGALDKESEADTEFIHREFRGTAANLRKIDRTLRENLKGWTLDRLNKAELAVLRLAVYELLFAEDIPAEVAINEAVELAKTFSDDDAPGFVNGVLGGIQRALMLAGIAASDPGESGENEENRENGGH